MSAPIWLLVGLALGAIAGAVIGWLFAQRRVAATESANAEAQKFHETAISQLRESFRAISTEALQKMHPDFLNLAKGELGQKEQAIAALVKPLKDHLEKFQTQHAQAQGFLSKHLETLAAETQQLRRILNNSQARGRWGEQTLRRVIEAAGMSAHCDFSEQTQSGDSKPDLVINLPGDRCIIVDAKVPDLEVLNAIDAADSVKRSETLAAHAAKLKTTIRALAERDYPRQFPKALDYVVLFLPAESLFSAALEGDQDLIVWAASKQILLTTPASLIGLLHCVHVSWQQYAQTENARLIAQSASELYSRINNFIRYFQRIGGGLEQANKAFNEAVASYDSRVRPQGERLESLGLDTAGKQLPEISPVEVSLRAVRGNGDALAPALLETTSSQ